MVQHLLAPRDDIRPAGGEARGLPVLTPVASTMSGSRYADADVPVFALLRAQIGLPQADARWWPPTSGRHVSFLTSDVPSPDAVSDPTIELLERTLAGLRAWQPLARA